VSVAANERPANNHNFLIALDKRSLNRFSRYNKTGSVIPITKWQ
jgi:hypothetical protein